MITGRQALVAQQSRMVYWQGMVQSKAPSQCAPISPKVCWCSGSSVEIEGPAPLWGTDNPRHIEWIDRRNASRRSIFHPRICLTLINIPWPGKVRALMSRLKGKFDFTAVLERAVKHPAKRIQEWAEEWKYKRYSGWVAVWQSANKNVGGGAYMCKGIVRMV